MGSGASASDPKRDTTEETVTREQMREDAAQSTSHQGDRDGGERIERRDSVIQSENHPVVEDKPIESGETNTEETEEDLKQDQKSQSRGPVPDDASRDEICSPEVSVRLLLKLLCATLSL